MARRSWAWLAVVCAIVTLGLTAGCGPSTPLSPGDRLHRSKCGACHVRPEPGRFDRAGWEAVLDEHSERVPLAPRDRARLLDHLSGAAEDPPGL